MNTKTKRYNVPVSDLVTEFWHHFDTTYQSPIAPIRVIIRNFNEYVEKRNEKLDEPLQYPYRNYGILSREIQKLALENGEWVRIFYRPNKPTTEIINPQKKLKVQETRDAKYTRAAYVRKQQFAATVKLKN